jgi:hypothetical protein
MILLVLYVFCTGDINHAEALLWLILTIELAVIEYSIDRVYDKLEEKKQ